MYHLTLKIHGQVQNVFFRDSTQELAKKLSLVGYVKNLADGALEIVVEGEEEGLKKMLDWCKIGPRLARIERVEQIWTEVVKVSFDSFKIIY